MNINQKAVQHKEPYKVTTQWWHRTIKLDGLHFSSSCASHRCHMPQSQAP